MSAPTGVVVVGFGEPEQPSIADVEDFLVRIFLANASLDGEPPIERARALAARRAPGLIEAYRQIGGSPLAAHLRHHRDSLARALEERGHAVPVFEATQFTRPSATEAVRAAVNAGCHDLVAVPVYPLCGVSTTLAALRAVREAAREVCLPGEVRGVAGWHLHPRYTALRADGVQRFVDDHGLDLSDPATLLFFSAHGTPVSYIEQGVPYDRYVEESCRAVASRLGVDTYVLGYQNHSNRGIEWTQPDIATVAEEADAARVVVVPISFMHEQSETLHELDIDLRATVEARGIEFNRVPVPHDDPEFGFVLADLVEPLLLGHDESGLGHVSCRCAGVAGVRCLNGDRPAA